MEECKHFNIFHSHSNSSAYFDVAFLRMVREQERNHIHVSAFDGAIEPVDGSFQSERREVGQDVHVSVFSGAVHGIRRVKVLVLNEELDKVEFSQRSGFDQKRLILLAKHASVMLVFDKFQHSVFDELVVVTAFRNVISNDDSDLRVVNSSNHFLVLVELKTYQN